MTASRPESRPGTRTLTAKNPGDLLAMVPYLLGFHPEDSLVLLTLGGAGRPFHARVDLPGDPATVQALVDHLAGVASDNGVTRAAVVLYTDDERLAAQVRAPLLERLDGAGVTVPVAIRADGARWFCVPGCRHGCPDEGTPYDVDSHAFTADAVYQGRVTYASRQALRDSLVGTDPDAVEAVAGAAERAAERLAASGRHPLGPPAPEAARAYLVQEGHWVGRRVRRFLADPGAVPLDAADVGRLLVDLAVVPVRDVAWAEMTQRNARAHVALWRDVVRRSPRDLVAPPAALLGFAAWLSGDGALAWCAVDRCQEVEPDYGLAGLLSQALAGAVPPSSWEPMDRRSLGLFAG